MGAVAVATATSIESQRPHRDFDPRARSNVTVAGGGVVAGRVRSRTGRSLRDAIVTLEYRDGAGRTRSTITDGRGLYRFDRVTPGRYQVFAVKSGFGRRYHGEDRSGEPVVSVDVGPGRVTDEVDIVLPAGAVVTGRVHDDAGLVVPDATVFLLQLIRQRGSVNLRVAGADVTDDRGVYRVFDLDPGAYYVRAVMSSYRTASDDEHGWSLDEPGSTNIQDGYAPSFYPGVTQLVVAQPVKVRESQELNGVDFAILRVAYGTVTGTVVAPMGVNPAGTEITLTPVEGDDVPGSVLSAWTRTRGQFTIGRVPPGRYVLGATGRTATGNAAFARQVVDVGDGKTENVSLLLVPGTTVNGAVLFEGATPTWRDVLDLQVTTHLETVSGAQDTRMTITVGDGTFSFRGLAPGPRRFGIRGLGETRALDRITLNGRDISDRAVRLDGSGRVTGLEIMVTDRVSVLRGVVRTSGDRAFTDAVVTVFSTDPERWSSTSRYVLTERPGHDGRYRVRGVPPGDYWVVAAPLEAVSADDWLTPRSLYRLRTQATRVSVRKGDTVDVDVDVRGR